MKLRFILIVFVLLLTYHNNSTAEITSLNVGYGTFIKATNHWIKPEPENIPFLLELSAEKDSFHLGEPIVIKFKIKNLSDVIQQIDFSAISICGYDNMFKKEIFFKKSINGLNGKLPFQKGESITKEIKLSQLCEVTKPDTFILWAYYNLPDDKGINSNDLKITIEP